MVKPEIVAYLQAHVKNHPIDALRQQLASEGVSAIDFEDSFKAAMRAAVAPPSPSHPSHASLVLLILGAIAAAAMLAALSLRRDASPPSSSGTVVSATGAAAYVGKGGYVVGLPGGYEAVSSFEDAQKTKELVYFCKKGTDPTNFLHEGLFGQMGIVRLQTQPNPFSGSLTGLDQLVRSLNAQHAAAGEKFSLKNIQVSSLRGVQVTVELPIPSVEAYLLGEKVLYRFFAGQDDEIYRGILDSLRDPRSEIL